MNSSSSSGGGGQKPWASSSGPAPGKRGGGGHKGAGGAGGGKGGGGKKKDYEPRVKITTTKREEVEIKTLERRIIDEAPEEGSMEATTAAFTELPLSRYTLSALDKAKFRTMTQIQRVAIPHALAGRDVLGAAKTGSGKTLGESKQARDGAEG